MNVGELFKIRSPTRWRNIPAEPAKDSRIASRLSPYLLSGFLKCNDCGAHLVIVSGRGGKWARYGCTQHWNRGACKNDLTIRRSEVEGEFLKELAAFSKFEFVTNFIFEEFVKQLWETLGSGDSAVTQLKKRQENTEAEIEKLVGCPC